ncbi:ArsR/SmtB family transcription factor [Patulibacter defluvii]|uniref:ArsR/SmtB family transcription factor n=1 Tax=Patulibacter defluvii TaxID=3095358 RepID=UPI002A74CCCE|nr:metalloregulator ArsR/SmtB family transcription factor [Patulibacter sp. DM4]
MATPRLRDKFPVPPLEQVELPTVLRTVGEPIRLEMVRLLADGRARPCHEICEALGLPNSTGSYHMRLLREAGLTRVRPEGTERRISLRREELEQRFPGLVDVLVRDDRD